MSNKKIKKEKSKVVKTSFDNFNYVVVPSPLKDFKEVRVMFTYLGKPVTRHLFVAENGNKNNDYYIAEAKKIINEEIANGTLPKQSKHYYKPKRVPTGGKIAIALLAVAAVGCGTFLTYKHLNPNFTVSFDTNGGSSIEAQSVQKGYLAKEPEDPTKLGYTFNGWVDEEGKDFDFEKTPINKNTTLYAYWGEDNVTVTFHYNNESLPGTKEVPVLKGHTIEASLIPDISDEYEGHTFAGWTDEYGDDFDFEEPIVEPTDIYADWDTNEYTVTFDARGGTSTVDSTTVEHGESIYTAPTASRSGYINTNVWYYGEGADEKQFKFGEDIVTSDMTLHCKWTEKASFSVNFYKGADDATWTEGTDPHTVTDEYEALPDDPQGELSRTGYRFVGWKRKSDGGIGIIPIVVPAESSQPAEEYTAQWEINKVTVTFNTDGGSFVAPQTIDYGATIQTAPQPTYEGHTIIDGKWYYKPDGSTETEFKFGADGTKVTANITVYCKWALNKVDITFNANGGIWQGQTQEQQDHIVTVDYGTIPAPTKELSREGYTFVGWNKKIVVAKAATTYTAQWTINSYTVSFDSMGGTVVSSIDVDHGGTISVEQKPAPTKPGFTLDGWYDQETGGNKFIFDGETGTATTVIADMKLYAHWVSATYTLTYDHNDGASTKTYETYNKGTAPGAAPKWTPTREGYTFTGWYVSTATDAQAFNFAATHDADVTAFAHWTEAVITHNVNYHFNYIIEGRTEEEVFPYPYAENETIYEPSIIPTRDGYTFDKWYKDSGCTQEYEFPGTMGTADIDLYAGWTEDIKEVDFLFINNTTGISIYNPLDVIPETGGTAEQVTANASPATAIGIRPSQLELIYTLSDLTAGGTEPDLTKSRIKITIGGGTTPIASDKFELGPNVNNTFKITIAKDIEITTSITIQVTDGE